MVSVDVRSLNKWLYCSPSPSKPIEQIKLIKDENSSPKGGLVAEIVSDVSSLLMLHTEGKLNCGKTKLIDMECEFRLKTIWSELKLSVKPDIHGKTLKVLPFRGYLIFSENNNLSLNEQLNSSL